MGIYGKRKRKKTQSLARLADKAISEIEGYFGDDGLGVRSGQASCQNCKVLWFTRWLSGSISCTISRKSWAVSSDTKRRRDLMIRVIRS